MAINCDGEDLKKKMLGYDNIRFTVACPIFHDVKYKHIFYPVFVSRI